MPALFLTEQDVRELVTIRDAIDVVQTAFAHLAQQAAVNQPRQRLRAGQTMLHQLAGADHERGQLGWKLYTTTRSGARFLVGLYDTQSGELTGLIEADFLGQLRTAAASGVATRWLARPEATQLGLIGTGLQARTQAWAIAAVRPLAGISVYGRDRQRREAFARELEGELNCPVQAAESAEQAIGEADIVVTATTSKTPVFDGARLRPGTHINAIGSNFLAKTELDLFTLQRCGLIVCDSREQCRLEAGEFVAGLETGLLTWDRIGELQDVVVGTLSRSRADEITLFKSVGLGLEDVALGSLILERAREQGRGTSLPF